jgi:hypothetical protein
MVFAAPPNSSEGDDQQAADQRAAGKDLQQADQVVAALEEAERRKCADRGERDEPERLRETVVVHGRPVQADRQQDRDHKERHQEHERRRRRPAGQGALPAYQREQDPERHGGVERQGIDHGLLLEQPDVTEHDEQHQRVARQQRRDHRQHRHAQCRRSERHGEQRRHGGHGAAKQDHGGGGPFRPCPEVEGPGAHDTRTIGRRSDTQKRTRRKTRTRPLRRSAFEALRRALAGVRRAPHGVSDAEQTRTRDCDQCELEAREGQGAATGVYGRVAPAALLGAGEAVVGVLGLREGRPGGKRQDGHCTDQ